MYGAFIGTLALIVAAKSMKDTLVSMHIVDGYKVRDPNDKESLRRLKQLSSFTTKLFSIIRANVKYASHPGCKRLTSRFQCPNDICRVQEKSYTYDQYAAYSVDKGKVIGICTKHEGKHVNENTMIYVYLHELAHVMSEQYDHDQAFWNNFAYLLEIAITHGLYVYEPFHLKNEHFCGENIQYTPFIPEK
jgi:hypothetical protein